MTNPSVRIEQVVGPLGQGVVAHQQHAADVDQAVLLGADRGAVGQVEHLAGDVAGAALLLARLALLDQVGVLGKAAGVEEQGDAVPLAERLDGVEVGQADRLAAAAVVGHGHHADGNPARLRLSAISRFQLGQVHVALERMPVARLGALGDDQVDGPGAASARCWPGWCRSGCCWG